MASAKSLALVMPAVQTGLIERSQEQPDHRRIDTAQGRLRAGFAPDLFPERQRADHEQERRQEYGDQAQGGDTPAADHSTEVGGKGEQRARHGLGGAVAGEKLIVRHPADRDHFGLQQRQHDVTAAEHQRAGTIEGVDEVNGLIGRLRC